MDLFVLCVVGFCDVECDGVVCMVGDYWFFWG